MSWFEALWWVRNEITLIKDGCLLSRVADRESLTFSKYPWKIIVLVGAWFLVIDALARFEG